MKNTFRIHVAIIMDGNGRWARQRGLPRPEGHREGARALRRAVESAVANGLHTLTLYAFSSDNWKRPQAEVAALMLLFRSYLLSEVETCVRQGVRLSVIGRRDRLPQSLVSLIAQAESQTAHCTRLHLRLAVDYSSRDAIVRAARSAETAADFSRALGPDVDLLIRTAGEQRLSDFLLWECAYAEFVFLPQLWPDFDESCLLEGLRQFQSRERKFGAVPSVVPEPAAARIDAQPA